MDVLKQVSSIINPARHWIGYGLLLATVVLRPGLATSQDAAAPPDAQTGATPAGQYAAEGAPPAASAALPTTAVERLMQHVYFLCSAECNGRRCGTPGRDVARDYLVEQLTALGVAPAFHGGSYTQGFAVTRGITVVGEPDVELNGTRLTPNVDYIVGPFSGSGTVERVPIVFAGYGINAPEFGWQDYAGLDVQGKAVLVVRGEPQENDEQSKFAGKQYTAHADLRRKAALARDLGAVALIVAENALTAGGADVLPVFRPTYSSANFDLPVLHLRSGLVDQLLTAQDGAALYDRLAAMDQTVEPASAELAANCTVNLTVEKDLTAGFNVAGVIPGSDPELAAQWVVIGAHYDHLGIGGDDSLAPSEYGTIHPGADDNASGVAAVLEVAHWAQTHRERFKRSLLICLFDGEELGLLGSTHLMKNPPVPADSIYSMLNLDMVGRLRDEQLSILGTGTAAEFTAILDQANQQYGLVLTTEPTGFGGSDQMSFIRDGIPALFFITGMHKEYSTPRDTADTLNYEGLAQVAGLVGVLASELADREETLTFVKPAGTVESSERSRADLKVTMGTVPGYDSGTNEGMAISDVVPGGPAEQAGLQAGDVIVKILDRRITNVYDFIFVLQDLSAGQTVPVTIRRDGAELVLPVTLAERNVDR